MKILFRPSLAEENEIKIASKYFDIATCRTECKDELVIPRYSALPYNDELERDMQNLGCNLINTHRMYKWVADFKYYNILKKYTPETWWMQDFDKCKYNGPFIVKGVTNSKKFQWNTHMYAPTKRDVMDIAIKLWDDSYIGCQEIIARKYIPLETFETGIADLPFTNEWRFFYFGNRLLSYGYYWSCADNPLKQEEIPLGCVEFAQEIANVVRNHINFFVLDIAKTQNGDFILIEVNDGQMSGPSENDMDVLYKNLHKELSKC